MLGLDVHDCAKARAHEYRSERCARDGPHRRTGPLLPARRRDRSEALRGIGVRIEDDVAVTRDGCENLSAILPSRAGDVEAWIAELVETAKPAVRRRIRRGGAEASASTSGPGGARSAV